MKELTDAFLNNLMASTWLEAMAVLFGLLSVWYARKANILVYPTGIVSVLIYVYICFVAKLYADMGINGFYFAMSLYGWYNWTRIGPQRQTIRVSFCKWPDHFVNLSGAFIFFFLIRYLLIHFTDSTVPNWDALTTSIFIIAMWLMARKKVENWIWWIVGDVISIPLYFSKGLVLSSFQYLVFLILAIMGLIEWIRIVEIQKKCQPSG